MERLVRLREPAALVALVGFGLNAAVLAVLAALDGVAVRGVAANLAYGFADPVLVLLVTGLVAACWAGAPTPRARGLTVAALALVAGSLTAALGFGIVELVLAADAGQAVDTLPWVMRPLVADVIAVGALVALLSRPSPAYAGRTGPALEAAAERAPAATPDPGPEAPDPHLEPAWTPDQAVGTVWRRAGDATTQAAATDWETGGQAAGRAGGWWEPPPDHPEAAEPPRRTET